METTNVVIAGAGIIGLSLAIELANHGLHVTVLERGRAMSESSWAAAGMLAANDPENPPQLADLSNLSISLYPQFLSQIERLCGSKVPLRTTAVLQSVSNHHNGVQLTRAELAHLEPQIETRHRSFIYIKEASLDPRDLYVALPEAAIAAGVTLLENTPVTAIEPGPTNISVQTPTTAISATHFVNCAGAWADSLINSAPGPPRITPVKGQIATLRLREGTTLTHVLRTPEIYLVPRGDHRVTIGATLERQAGFDKTVDPQTITNLVEIAAELYPPIADAKLLESWVGLRPGSPDELPFIGPTSNAADLPHTWIAAGHFRNGILLAPGTARVLSQLIRGEDPEVDLTPFAPNRTLPAIPRPLDRRVPPASDKLAIAAL